MAERKKHKLTLWVMKCIVLAKANCESRWEVTDSQETLIARRKKSSLAVVNTEKKCFLCNFQSLCTLLGVQVLRASARWRNTLHILDVIYRDDAEKQAEERNISILLARHAQVSVDDFTWNVVAFFVSRLGCPHMDFFPLDCWLETLFSLRSDQLFPIISFLRLSLRRWFFAWRHFSWPKACGWPNDIKRLNSPHFVFPFNELKTEGTRHQLCKQNLSPSNQLGK